MRIRRLILVLLTTFMVGSAGGQPSTVESDMAEVLGGGDGLASQQKPDPGRVPPRPDAPTNLAASGITDRKVDLTWTDNADDETEYWVERRLVSEVGFTLISPKLAVDATSYTDDEVARGASYVYVVVACGEYGCSYPSNQVTVNIPPMSFFIGD